MRDDGVDAGSADEGAGDDAVEHENDEADASNEGADDDAVEHENDEADAAVDVASAADEDWQGLRGATCTPGIALRVAFCLESKLSLESLLKRGALPYLVGFARSSYTLLGQNS